MAQFMLHVVRGACSVPRSSWSEVGGVFCVKCSVIVFGVFRVIIL